MKQFFLTVAGVFVGLILFMVVIPVILIAALVGAASKGSANEMVPAAAVLQLDLRGGLTDQTPKNPFAAFSGSGMSVMSVEETLRRAEKDDRVKGLFIRLPEGGMAPAAADELRQAVKHFRATGKTVYAHSQGLYASGVVTSTYMLASSANEIWMQPDSAFQVTGFASQDIFFKRLFDKYGVKAQFEQRKEYKNAVNPYLADDYTPAHKESQLSWMGSIYRTGLTTAAADRGKNPDALIKDIEAGPWSAQDAQVKGLIDKVGQVKEAEDAILAKAGKGAKLMDFQDYASGASRSDKAGAAIGGKPVIAVIGAEGAIMTGKGGGGGNPFSTDSTVWSDDVAQSIYDAAEDKNVKAIVFRVSSPGGSDTASEQILAAVKAARKAGKPVVVSMGTYAASGGYWISSQADYIVAQPTTLTGSIGVYGGKFMLGDALKRFGVDMRSTTVGGEYANIYDPGAEFTPAQHAAFSAWMDHIYAGFVTRVAQGRKLPVERVQEIAKGRVWTGEQALNLKLVDKLGGFYDAVDEAKRLAGVKGEAHLKDMDRVKGPFEAIQRMLGVSASSVRTLAAAAWIFGDPKAQAVMDKMAQARLRDQGAMVLADTPVH